MGDNSLKWVTLFRLIVHVSKMKRKSWLKCIVLGSLTCISLTFALHMMKISPLDISMLARDNWSANTWTTRKSILSEIQSESSDVRDGFNFSQNFLPAGDKEDNFYMTSMCTQDVTSNSAQLPKVTIIYSLHEFRASQQATEFLRQNLAALPVDVTDDIIVTADPDQPLAEKEGVEDFLDGCSICRLFFVDGTIYDHRNFASRFARNDILVFVDARILPTKDWLQPLLFNFNDTKRIVCPTLHTRYEDGSANSFGVALNEITWSLNVIRAGLDGKLLETAREYNQTFVAQTAITKEVFAISKEFFRELGQFDTRANISGGEDVMFSLKAINCGGRVVLALCSTVYLNIQRETVAEFSLSPFLDFRNPSFDTPSAGYSNELYSQALAKIWLDIFTKKYHTCVISKGIDLTVVNRSPVQSPSNIRYLNRDSSLVLTPNGQRLRLEADVNKRMGILQCETKNFRYLIIRHQPRMVAPTKYARFYGYIRTLDGMSSVGLLTNESLDVVANPSPAMTVIPGNLVLTRNASMWVGPFSYTNGAFIYHHSWCLTLTPDNLFALKKCVAGTGAQLFSFANHVIRPQAEAERCACAKELLHTSGQLFLSRCAESGDVGRFKLDVEFKEKCIK
ncbi:unnamed protein product [Lymnaea stagnalis]|uniref:Uncharacterized protein n=1 Tax=Lymnaea stagnalis TaxID=6523 RepID=A0AAV2H520_LYMST